MNAASIPKSVIGITSAVILMSACSSYDRLTYAMSENPVELTSIALDSGERIFLKNCSGCHGEALDGNGLISIDSAVKPADLTANRAPDGVLAMRISYGVGDAMPAWREVLNDEQVWQVVHYIRSKKNVDKTARKWSWK